MSKTFLRGLTLLEAISELGPITISDLARHTGLDKATVSRTVTVCERDGWLVRVDGRLVIGPRAVLLGHGSGIDQIVRRAEALVHAVAGVTGLLSQAYGLIGAEAVVLASANGRDLSLPSGLVARLPLWTTAASQAIAAQLDDATLDALLPPDPLPDADAVIAGFSPTVVAYFVPSRVSGVTPPGLPGDRHELDERLAAIRAAGIARDRGDLHPDLHCVAVPWPRPGLPAALACVGSAADVAANPRLAERALSAAASPTATPEDVVTAAAEAMAAHHRSAHASAAPE